MSLKLRNMKKSRRKSTYHHVKYYIANQVLIFQENRVPPAAQLAEGLNLTASAVSRAMIELADEPCSWVEKIDRGGPRNSYYKIVATDIQCEQFKDSLSSTRPRKTKFSKKSKVLG